LSALRNPLKGNIGIITLLPSLLLPQAKVEMDAPLTSNPNVAVRRVPYTGEEVSRGVFALRRILRGELIECAPCLKFTAKEHEEHALRTVLQHYTFAAGGGEFYLALGIGSLFNHADPPNVEYRIKRSMQEIQYFACRTIEEGEELCIFYGHNLWFQTVVGVQSAPSLEKGIAACASLPFEEDDE
jgi:SET domain-containing protein